MTDLVTTARTSPAPARLDPVEVGVELEPYRRRLTGYCYRMLGSGFEAEDAVQETLVRAWRGIDGFDGRAPLEAWLFRIATNVCLNMLRSRQRRAMPMDLGPASPASSTVGRPQPASTWVEPVPDSRVLPDAGDPAERAVSRETVRLAFVAALQHLPPRQRAVLILRDVLRWRSTEVAELLDTTVVSVKSALQRARARLAARDLDQPQLPPAGTADQQRLLERYVDAFESYDIEELVTLLHEDATLSMPPYELWLQGRDDVARWHLGPGSDCAGSRLVPLAASGSPAFAQYRPDPLGGGYEPFALQVLDVSGDRVRRVHAFLDVRLFPLFGLPLDGPSGSGTGTGG